MSFRRFMLVLRVRLKARFCRDMKSALAEHYFTVIPAQAEYYFIVIPAQAGIQWFSERYRFPPARE